MNVYKNSKNISKRNFDPIIICKKKKKILKNLYLEERIQWNIFLNIMVQKKPLHLKKFLFFFI